MNYQFQSVVDPRISNTSSNGQNQNQQQPQQYTSHFTQSQSQYIPNSNYQSQFVQQGQQQAPTSQHTYYTTSVVYQPNPAQSSYLTESQKISGTSNYGNKNIEDVIESVKRSAAIRASQTTSNQQLPSSSAQLQNSNQGQYTMSVSQSNNNNNYVQSENAYLNGSFQPNKFASSLTTSQPFQNVLTNSYNLNVPSSNMNYLQTPDRSTQIKGSNVKILTPNKSPSTCKIVFGGSPTKSQIQQEVDQYSMRALTESQANQKSVDTLKNTIQFISATNSSPEKRQTAKSLINTMNGTQ